MSLRVCTGDPRELEETNLKLHLLSDGTLAHESGVTFGMLKALAVLTTVLFYGLGGYSTNSSGHRMLAYV